MSLSSHVNNSAVLSSIEQSKAMREKWELIYS